MSGMPVSQESMQIYSGGQSSKVTIGAVSAQSGALACKSLILCSTVDCFIRQGASPTALADGTDQFLPAYAPFRYAGFKSGNKLAVIGSAAGTLYITPEK